MIKRLFFPQIFSIDNKGMQIALVDSLKVKQDLNGNHKNNLRLIKAIEIKKQ